MKHVLFLAYPHYADFEIGHALFLLRKTAKAKVITATVDGEPVESLGGLQTVANGLLSDFDIQRFDLILISGGDGVDTILNDESVRTALQDAVSFGVPIASICASALLLGKAGILDGRDFTCLPHTYENHQELFSKARYTGNAIETSENIITAKGTAFAEFAVAACQLVGALQEPERADAMLKFCKGGAAE
ncbi:DJ-1/PfpI family protein [Indiicoccus explosivorum]|uniref:DJ-1/PfpI family protein n=1 Tax=Indiicoccus explosivorum TaxID=1917864 RepID=UPI000B43D1C1|nr:DJ-1/PfpI family protein [Indiicoccus explosivorum]